MLLYQPSRPKKCSFYVMLTRVLNEERHVGVGEQCAWRSGGNLGCLSQPSTLFEAGSLSFVPSCAALSGPPDSGDSHVLRPVCHCGSTVGSHVHFRAVSLWVLSTGLRFEQRASYSLNRIPSRMKTIFLFKKNRIHSFILPSLGSNATSSKNLYIYTIQCINPTWHLLISLH